MPRVPPLTSAPPSLSPSAAFCAKSGGGSCAAPLAAAVRQGLFDGEEEEVPLCVFYDLDLFDAHLATLKEAFGSTVQHRMAIKACPLSRLMRYAYERWGFGVECASMGEVKLALEHCQIPASMLVFDSPAKTRKELQFALDQKIHTNLDNFVEYQRAKELLAAKATTAKTQTATGLGPEMGVVGLRINPLVGAGQIEALSVSTPESKFGVPVTELEKIRAAFRESPWLTCLHIHIGSGGMGLVVLTQGIRVLVDTAKDLNGSLGRRQISVLDIGGGLPANYASDRMDEGPVPNFSQYAKHLKEQIPELFSGEFQVITEFGQALFAKMGFLASRIEWLKGSEEKPIVVSHFGADLCLRQAYTTQHPRRLEAYKADGSAFETEGEPESKRRKRCLVAGPLCFQGDVVSKDALLPAELKEGDLLVMKDAGANTLSMHSRHCSRLAPPVYGYSPPRGPRGPRRFRDRDSTGRVVVVEPRDPQDAQRHLRVRGVRGDQAARDDATVVRLVGPAGLAEDARVGRRHCHLLLSR